MATRPNPQQAALAGLSRATATDPDDTSQSALLAREQARNDDGTSIGSQGFMHQQWAPYFEAMTEAGERQGGHFAGVKSAPGLSEDDNMADDPNWWLSGEMPRGGVAAPMGAHAPAGNQQAGFTDRIQNMIPAAMRGLYKFLVPNFQPDPLPPQNVTGARG